MGAWRSQSQARDTAVMAEQGPPDKTGFWHRFSRQETGPQRVVVGVAGTVTAVATCIGGVYAVANVVQDKESPVASSTTASTTASRSETAATATDTEAAAAASGSPVTTATASAAPVKAGQTLVAQGSPEADQLVHTLVDADGGRVDLDVVILADSRDRSPQFIMRLWYNCQGLPAGEPPGEDLCDRAMLVFDDADPSPARYDAPRRIELTGLWADNRPTGLGYGARGLEFFPTQATS